jgi:hypothetical protein
MEVSMTVADARDALRYENKELIDPLLDVVKLAKPSSALERLIHKGWKRGLEKREYVNNELNKYGDSDFVDALGEEIRILEVLLKVAELQEGAAAEAWQQHFQEDIDILNELLK